MAEIKLFTPHDFDLKENGEVVVAFSQTDAVDRDSDYTFPDFLENPGARVPISPYGHGIWPQKGAKLPVGKGDIKEEGGWAVLRGAFFMNTEGGREHYETVKAMGDDQQWSYGYDVTAKADPPSNVKARRGIKKAKVFEVSPVFLGAQNATHTMAIKSASEDLAELLGETDGALAALEEGLLAGLPFAEMSERVLHGIEAFTKRTEAIAEIRVKEGRALSTARLTELQSHRDALAAGVAAINKLLEGAAPKPKEETEDEQKARRLRMQAKIGETRLSLASLRTH